MEITRETKLIEVLEYEACGRCGGTGEYSWNQVDGSRCYGCNGKGSRLTKRGQAAFAYSQALRTMPVECLAVGDSIMVSTGWMREGWSRVLEIGEPKWGVTGHILREGDPRLDEARADENCKVEPYKADGEFIVHHREVEATAKRGSTNLALGDEVMTSILADDKVVHLKAVAAFQDSLTKAGKPRKRAIA